MSEPLLAIRFLSFQAFPQDIQGLLVTSRHGIEAVLQNAPKLNRELNREVPLFAVGESTAQAARQAGFSNCIVADNSAAQAVEFIVARKDAFQAGGIGYLRGEEITLDAAGLLARSGIVTHERVVYAADRITTLTPYLENLLAAQKIHGVCLFSVRTAAALIESLQRLEKVPSTERMWALCSSEKIKLAISTLPWQGVEILPPHEVMPWEKAAKTCTRAFTDFKLINDMV